jgi:trans-2,3-dihydro-3-hydroxyanthranilate isomerase
MKAPLAFRLLNVFAVPGERFSGNALCVFEDARELGEAQMQAIAREANLAETTFILPSESAAAKVRIFTPASEMPFAGHPTLGTAHVVRSVRDAGESFSLEMKAGAIPVSAIGDDWTLRANEPKARAFPGTRAEMAEALSLEERDVAGDPLWIDTGVEQLVVPVASVEAVRRTSIALERAARIGLGPLNAYVWTRDADDTVVARFFYAERGAVLEDPATGSACANLGGWLVLHGIMPRELRVAQGEQTGRPSALGLRLTAQGDIFVSGRVVEIGRGDLLV